MLKIVIVSAEIQIDAILFEECSPIFLQHAVVAVIAAGWFSVSMWLWRRHVRDDNAAWQEKQRSRRS